MALNGPMDLAWEIDKAGNIGHLHVNTLRVPRYGYLIKLLAVCKMMDVQVISAEFSDYQITFEPWIIVAVDRGACIDFLGAYQRGYVIEEGEPELCLRTARWSEQADQQEFDSASDKLDYLLSDKQLRAETSFGCFAECPDLVTLAEEIENFALSGCRLQRCDRDSEQRSNLYLRAAGRLVPFTCDLTYFLGAFQCEKLEDLANRWVACGPNIDFGSKFVPKNGTDVSYRMTLLERLAHVNR